MMTAFLFIEYSDINRKISTSSKRAKIPSARFIFSVARWLLKLFCEGESLSA
jgi:hypothetical protein